MKNLSALTFGAIPFDFAEGTLFSRLSEEAQNAIVSAVLEGDDLVLPEMSDSVKEEIRQWAEADETN